MEEVARLLEGLPIDVEAMMEGTIFEPYQPVLAINGMYIDYALYETALLGLLCQSSGIVTKAARCKKAAGDKLVISFGARRMHPAMAPMIERSAYIGGCDGVAVVKSAEVLEIDPSGTIPHALVLLMGNSVNAVKAFNEIIDKKVRRVALIDTLDDEKFEALKVAEALGKDLFAVRLDTPSSRRGNFLRLLEEVRWELDYRGYDYVKLFVSGGLDEYEILKLNSVADAYGVGTALSNAPVLNFALDICEIDGVPMAKRGKKSGRKRVLRCPDCFKSVVIPAFKEIEKCPCGGKYESLLKPFISKGKVVAELKPPKEIRKYVLEQLKKVKLNNIDVQSTWKDY